MNRKERRRVEKQMGVFKSRKKESRSEKFQRYAENAQRGKDKQKEMKEKVRVNENQHEDKKQSADVASKATELMISEGIPYFEALEKAKKLLRKEK